MVTANRAAVAPGWISALTRTARWTYCFSLMNRSIKRGATVLGTIVVLVLTLGGAVHAATVDKGEERKAIQAYAAGRYEEALDLYAKFYADTLNPIYLRNIGRCHEKLKQPDKAIDAFHDYLAKGGKKISADEKAEINGYIKEMEALRDEQAGKQQAPPPVPVAPAPAPVQPIQAAPQPEAPPPGYTAQPAGAYPGAPGAYPPPPDQQPNGTLVAQPPPPEAQSGSVFGKWWFWTIVGAVIVGGVVTAVALSSGATTKPSCPLGISCE
jgi:hypothetical protein